MRMMTFRPKRLLALFTIRTRLEAFAIIYALSLGATQRGSAYLQEYPGWGGRLLFLACCCAVMMAGAKILDCLRLEEAARARQIAEGAS